MALEDQAKGSRKRVQVLKKMIIRFIFISIFILLILCAILLVKVVSLETQLSLVTKRLDIVTQRMEEQSNVSELELGTVSDNNSAKPQEQIHIEDNTASIDALSGDVLQEEEQEHLRKVYLTFDDGPSGYTQEILEILDEYDVKATFFVLGKEDDVSQKAMKDIVDQGHTLGMHSYSHKYNEIYRSVESFTEDFNKLRDYLFNVTGVQSNYYRFPGGSSNTISPVNMNEFAEFLEEEKVPFFDWNISSGDGSSSRLSVQEIVDNCMNGIEQQTSIILLHDSTQKRTTVDALPIIIENILAMENTVILPITEDTQPIQHIHKNVNE